MAQVSVVLILVGMSVSNLSQNRLEMKWGKSYFRVQVLCYSHRRVLNFDQQLLLQRADISKFPICSDYHNLFTQSLQVTCMTLERP